MGSSLLVCLLVFHSLHGFGLTPRQRLLLSCLYSEVFLTAESGIESTRVLPNSNTNQPSRREAGNVQQKEPTGHTCSHVHTLHWLNIPAVRDGTYWLNSIPTPRTVTLVHLAWSDEEAGTLNTLTSTLSFSPFLQLSLWNGSSFCWKRSWLMWYR